MRTRFLTKEKAGNIEFYYWYGVEVYVRDIKEVMKNQRLDLLAHNMLGNVNDWWIIAEVNNDFLPICNKKIEQIKVPVSFEVKKK